MTFAVATLVFEVQTGGNDNNGGGFDSGVGSPGTDYSQQASAQVAFTDLVIGGIGNTDKLTSAAHPFGSTSPGNVINITGGTGFTTGLYRVLSVSGSTATMDRSVGTASSTSGTGNLGGAWATVGKALSNMTAGGQVTYIKGGTYQITSTLNGPTDTGYSVSRLIGYSTTRGDKGQATIQANATTFAMLKCDAAVNCYCFENITWDGNSQTGVDGANLTGGGHVAFINSIFKNFVNRYCVLTSNDQSQPSFTCLNCDFTGNAFTVTTAGCIIDNSLRSSIVIKNCYFANNSINGTNQAGGIWSGQYCTITNCIFYNNTGTNMSGINTQSTSNGGYIANNVFHSNALDGITAFGTPNAVMEYVIENNIFTSNGRYGIDASMTASTTIPYVRNNAYYNNSSGAINGFTDVSAVTLTGLPYVNAPTDFSLNATAGQGAACRAAATPGAIGVSSVVGTGHLDIGPLQHADPATSTGYAFLSVA